MKVNFQSILTLIRFDWFHHQFFLLSSSSSFSFQPRESRSEDRPQAGSLRESPPPKSPLPPPSWLSDEPGKGTKVYCYASDVFGKHSLCWNHFVKSHNRFLKNIWINLMEFIAFKTMASKLLGLWGHQKCLGVKEWTEV